MDTMLAWLLRMHSSYQCIVYKTFLATMLEVNLRQIFAVLCTHNQLL